MDLLSVQISTLGLQDSLDLYSSLQGTIALNGVDLAIPCLDFKALRPFILLLLLHAWRTPNTDALTLYEHSHQSTCTAC